MLSSVGSTGDRHNIEGDLGGQGSKLDDEVRSLASSQRN